MTEPSQPADAENPYRSPAPVDNEDEAPAVACSFCGLTFTKTGPLVEAPQQRAYICAGCARLSLATIESKTRSGRLGRAGVVLALTAAIGWIVWGVLVDSSQRSLLTYALAAGLAWFVVSRVVALARSMSRRD